MKVVVQAIPTFVMICFKLPLSLCHDIEVVIKNFFWGQQGERRKIHWKKWETLCLSKKDGGLNFKDLSKFNEAMLAKQVWRLIHDKESPFYRVFKVKFFPSGDIFSAQLKSGSYAWHSILGAWKVVAIGARWRIGNGLTTRVYSNSWLPSGGLGRITSPLSEIPADAIVADLLEVESGWWNRALIDRNFLPFEAQKIKSIPICTTPQEDILIWPKTRDGNYSIKSGYQLLRELEINELASLSDSGENKKFCSGLWKMKVPNKLKTFAWRACTNSLPTLDNLVKRKIVSSPICPMCKREPETVIHTLWSCETLGPV